MAWPRGQRRRLQERVDAVPSWWHSIDLGHRVRTAGHKGAAALREELRALALPDLSGKSVLDIGGWDGFFAFEAERRGPGRHRRPLHVGDGRPRPARELAVVETEAVVLPGLEHEALWRFFPGTELNADVSNWWAPNSTAAARRSERRGLRVGDGRLGPSGGARGRIPRAAPLSPDRPRG